MKQTLHIYWALVCSALLALTACSETEGEQAMQADGLVAVRATLETSAVESAYRHRLYLVENDAITRSASALSAGALAPFRVEAGFYGLLAVAAERDENLTFPVDATGALSAYGVRITNMANPIPDLLIGRNDRFEVKNSAVAAPIEMQRVVSQLTVRVVGLKALHAETLSVTIPSMYDRIAADGTLGNSGNTFSHKTITLKKDAVGCYGGQAIVLPTDVNAATLAFVFEINGKSYRSVQNVRIEANRQYNLTVTAQFQDDTTIKLTPVISYLPWGNTTQITDDPNFPLTDDRPANTNFTVEIFRNQQWEQLFVHGAKVSDYVANPSAGYTQHNMGFAMFTDPFAQPLKVRVTRSAKSFSKVAIRPLSYGIRPIVQTANSVEFMLDSPTRKVSVEFDDDRMENLFLLPDLPDVSVPTGNNVTYYGAGIHNMGRKEIKYKDNQTIYLAEGALVYGSIYAIGCRNLTIRGRGILCSSQENHGDGRKAQIETFSCDNFKVEGVMLRDTPNWTLKMVGSTGVHIDNIKEIGWMMNSDGMDFVCCRNVLVENTFQRNYDDNVTVKAFNGKTDYVAAHTAADGSYTDGAIWTVFYLTQDRFDVYDYEVRNCVLWADKGHNMLVGPESRGIPFRNIRFHHNIVLENRQNDAVYPGAMAVMIADNGTFEQIAFENIEVEDINGGKVFCAHFTNAWAFGGLYGQWARQLTLRNIAYTGTRATKSWIRGRNDAQCINGVTIENFTVNGARVVDGTGPYLEVNSFVKNGTFQ